MVKQPGVESRLQLSMESKTSVALYRANVRKENPGLLVVNHRVRPRSSAPEPACDRDVNHRQLNRYRRSGYDGLARKICSTG